MAQILGRAIQIETDIDTIESFYDVPMIDPVAPYIYALRDHGIIEGRTELFYDIDSPITRNEVAKIFATTFLNFGNN